MKGPLSRHGGSAMKVTVFHPYHRIAAYMFLCRVVSLLAMALFVPSGTEGGDRLCSCRIFAGVDEKLAHA